MKRYLFVVLLSSLVLNLYARDFANGEKIYLNTDQSHESLDWGADDAKVFLYFFGGSSGDAWVSMTPISSGSKIYSGTFTANKNYNKVIVVRKNPATPDANWEGTWNQTCDLSIPDYRGCNVLNKFWKKNGDCPEDPYSEWKTYTPAASTIPTVSLIKSSGVTEEIVHVCPDAAGDPFSLKVKLNSGKTAYVYDDVMGHGWFKSTNGTSWTSIDDNAGKIRDNEDEQDVVRNTLPSPLPTTLYYYLYSNIASGRRLIKIVNDAECELDCSITSFETAISAVNADDNTYTLDGMVAFGKANGSLVIECDGKSTTITSPKSPQSFSLTKVPAATVDGTTTTATAHFTGDAACTKTITIHVPNAKEAIDEVTVDSLTGKVIVLVPQDADPSNDYVWIINGVEHTKAGGQSQNCTIPAISVDSTATLVYKEFYPAPGTMSDMMSNGGYEDKTFNYGKYGKVSAISDYNYWGIHQQSNPDQAVNFYDTCSLRPSPADPLDNGFAVVRNANKFHPTFAKVKAREGNNFALFDAATGAAGGNKRAWYATTANNPNLKLKKGTTYVLSFWAANITNYGEMENAARFKFRIQYNGKTWESKVLDLGTAEFRNNIWHQHSETFYAAEDCNNVTISVVNLNTNELNVGNDFALDDIQFHAISSVSKVVKSQQQFTLNTHEPKVDAFTATVQPVACDGTNYTIAMHVEYQNPNSQLIIKDVTTGTEYPYYLPAVAFDTPASIDKNIVISTKEATHEWEAYFADWTTAKRTTTTVIPGFPAIEAKNFSFAAPSCTDLTTTLTFDLDYTYQQGTLTYWVDDLGDSTATYTIADKNKQTLTGLTFAGVPADGKNTHVLHVSFDGVNSCVKEYNLPEAPFSPVISSVVINGVPATVLCNAEDYQANVTITTPYDATGRNIILTFDDNGDASQTVAATGTSTSATLTLHTIGGAAQAVTAAYELTPTCTTTSADFTPPTRINCEKTDTTLCEGQSLIWKGGTYPIVPYIGTDTFKNGYDSLILTILALPRIAIGSIAMTCDSANEIRIPFTVTNGTPDTYDIAVNGNHYAGAVDGTDIVFSLATMEAGDYSATVTVGETGIDCETTTPASFTIALSGHVYSKWTDVLFISNKEGRFNGYQWFADGAEMAGETMQRLYDPKGLSGTTIQYHCRLTTTDGKTLYTCPQTFDEVTPSRTINTDNTASQVRGIYDTMGRPVNGTPARGIYIVVSEQNGERITTKLIVHE